jgi:dTMP kinase
MQLQGDARRGFFVTFEGPDGSGKSTQSQRLAARLAGEGFDVVATREPGGTPLGEEVRQILLHSSELDPAATTDALLFNAARAQLVARVIRPALARGAVVVCDRYADSTLAYQGYGAGQSLEELRAIGSFATGGLVPDMTVLFDIPVDEGLRRKSDEANRFEKAVTVEFHQRVRDGFLAMAAGSPQRFSIVDATRPPDNLAEDVFELVFARLDRSISRRSEPKANSVRMDK